MSSAVGHRFQLSNYTTFDALAGGPQYKHEDRRLGTTTNDWTAVFVNATNDMAGFFAQCGFVLFNTDGANALNYRVLAALSTQAGVTTFTHTASTALAAGANTGLVMLAAANHVYRLLVLQVESAVDDSHATFEAQICFAD